MINRNHISVRFNERSWAIGLISKINSIVSTHDLVIKSAGGESTISKGKGKVMFPDVILYGDTSLTHILQGWELKMPDVPITNTDFVYDAQRKAKALGLNSCVIWNFSFVKFYVLKEGEEDFEVVKQWENPMIAKRDDVFSYRKDWEDTLQDVLLTVNQFFLTNKVTGSNVGDIISQNVINQLINENKYLVAENYRRASAKNSILDAIIDLWWEGIKMEYALDESNKYVAYAKSVILNWAYRIIFAHLIKRFQNSAIIVDNIDYNCTPEKANDIFKKITSHSDFYNVFRGIEYDEILPSSTWDSLVELSLFLKENGITEIDQSMLQNILEKCINTTRRELNGQFTTPKVLARILAQITVHDWTADCLDPCCGTGTIANAILTKKKEKCESISKAISTTWASDKYALPLQIANISMTSSETINLANRLFQSNALDLSLGKIIEIIDPDNGQIVKYALPLQGAICSNLPFITCENIFDDDKEKIHINSLDQELDGRSDLCFYLTLHLSNLLTNDGYLGIIISNSWLGTSAGSVFYKALIQYFNLKQVHISGAGRWFKNADIVTTILLLQKKQLDKCQSTSFFIWKAPLEKIEAYPSVETCIINSSLLNQALDSNVMEKAEYTSQEIENLHSMNISYNALFHNVNWLLKFREVLIPIESLFKVFRGSRRGWDKLFFPKGKNKIEKEFLYPALFNAKNVNTLIAKPDTQAFCCSKGMGELRSSYPGAYSWIKSFENQKNNVGKPLPVVLARAKEAWYEMLPNEVAQFFTMMNPDNRYFFGRFQNPSFINQRLIGLTLLENSYDLELCHALLNSIVMKFYIEAVGFGRGQGVLDINKDSISQCYMLDPSLLNIKQIEEIKCYFKQVLRKSISSIDEEIEDKDWTEFNLAVLRAYHLENFYSQIASSLKSMRKIRKAATEKYEVSEFLRPDRLVSWKDNEDLSLAAEPYYHYGSIDICLPTNRTIQSKQMANFVLMYAINPLAREKTQNAGKIALGIKEKYLDQEIYAAYQDVTHIIFHYWKNEEAKIIKLDNPVRIVDKDDVPDGYLLRQEKEAKRFLLLDYSPDKILENNLDILKVQRSKERRYLPFITSLSAILK